MKQSAPANLSTFHSPLSTPTIGLAPFAQHRGKIWPWENVQRLVTLLVDKGYRVLLFGSRQEAPQLETLARSEECVTPISPSMLEGVDAKRTGACVTSLAGKQSFAEELEIIKGLSLMVSMDSANMHFASLFGVPVVSIWGATHPDFGFYGYGQNPANALCANLPCQPCSAFGQKPCRFGDYRCLRAITPEMVLDKITATANQ